MSSRPLDVVLCEAYQEQEALYARALALTCNEPADRWLPEVLTLFGRIAVIEGTVGPAKRQWQEGGARSAALDACLERVAGLIRELQAAVASAYERTEAGQRDLLPELDRLARAQHMRRAYARTLGGP